MLIEWCFRKDQELKALGVAGRSREDLQRGTNRSLDLTSVKKLCTARILIGVDQRVSSRGSPLPEVLTLVAPQIGLIIALAHRVTRLPFLPAYNS